MHLILWLTLIADSMTLGVTVYAAARRPILIDFVIISLAMSTFGLALHQVLARDSHIFILLCTVAMNLILTYRLSRFASHKQTVRSRRPGQTTKG